MSCLCRQWPTRACTPHRAGCRSAAGPGVLPLLIACPICCTRNRTALARRTCKNRRRRPQDAGGANVDCSHSPVASCSIDLPFLQSICRLQKAAKKKLEKLEKRALGWGGFDDALKPQQVGAAGGGRGKGRAAAA